MCCSTRAPSRLDRPDRPRPTPSVLWTRVSAPAWPGCWRSPVRRFCRSSRSESPKSSGRRGAEVGKSFGVVLSVEKWFCQLINDAFVLSASVPSWPILSAAIIKRRWQKPLCYLPRLSTHISAFCYLWSIKTTWFPDLALKRQLMALMHFSHLERSASDTRQWKCSRFSALYFGSVVASLKGWHSAHVG